MFFSLWKLQRFEKGKWRFGIVFTTFSILLENISQFLYDYRGCIEWAGGRKNVVCDTSQITLTVSDSALLFWRLFVFYLKLFYL